MDGCSYSQEPLEIILTIEETAKLMEKVTHDLSSSCYASIKPSILSLSFNLKRHGPSLEQLHASHLKLLHQAMRSACRDPTLDLVSRVHLLEIIELRSLNWAPSQHVINFYKMKLDEIKELSEAQSAPAVAQELSEAQSASVVVQTNCSKPSSRLNANAPDFCLGMSVSNQPKKPVSFNPDCSPFVSLHQPPFNQDQLISNSVDSLVSNPVNVLSRKEHVNDGTDDLSSKEVKNYFSLDNITGQDAIGNKNVITEHGDSISKGTFTEHGDSISKGTFTEHGDSISNDTFTVQEDYSTREVFTPQGDYIGKETTAIQSNKDENNIIIKEGFTVQSDNDIKTSVTVHTMDGEITLTSVSMDLLHSAQKILEEGLKDKIAVKTIPSQTTSLNVASDELIYKRNELLELAESHLSKLPPTGKEKIDKEIPCIVKIKPRVK